MVADQPICPHLHACTREAGAFDYWFWILLLTASLLQLTKLVQLQLTKLLSMVMARLRGSAQQRAAAARATADCSYVKHLKLMLVFRHHISLHSCWWMIGHRRLPVGRFKLWPGAVAVTILPPHLSAVFSTPAHSLQTTIITITPPFTAT